MWGSIHRNQKGSSIQNPMGFPRVSASRKECNRVLIWDPSPIFQEKKRAFPNPMKFSGSKTYQHRYLSNLRLASNSMDLLDLLLLAVNSQVPWSSGSSPSSHPRNLVPKKEIGDSSMIHRFHDEGSVQNQSITQSKTERWFSFQESFIES